MVCLDDAKGKRCVSNGFETEKVAEADLSLMGRIQYVCVCSFLSRPSKLAISSPQKTAKTSLKMCDFSPMV